MIGSNPDDLPEISHENDAQRIMCLTIAVLRCSRASLAFTTSRDV